MGMNALEIVGLITGTILALVQPIMLFVVYIPLKSQSIDFMATIDVMVSYLIGIFAVIYAAVTVSKLAFKEHNLVEDKYFFFMSAAVFGLIGIPVLVFNMIELFSHPEMFHLHVDLVTGLALLVDVIFGLASAITLGFGYDPIKKKKEYQRV